MDAKLKALKVVDLKHILSSASVSVPAKATKNDLIAKILGSKEALDAHAKLYPPDDLLAPPEEYATRSLLIYILTFSRVDWNVDQPESAVEATPAPAPPPAKPTSTSAAAPAPATTTEAPADADPELEKRRQRAARFGIPLVEPKAPANGKRHTTQAPKKPVAVAAAAAVRVFNTQSSIILNLF